MRQPGDVADAVATAPDVVDLVMFMLNRFHATCNMRTKLLTSYPVVALPIYLLLRLSLFALH